jgi:hypothetical protein
VVVFGCLTVDGAQDDILTADFEGKNYGDWQVTGEAFGPGPSRGTLPGQMKVTGFEGKRLVNTYYKGDDTTGTLTSPAFEIKRKYINFLISGGKHPGQACTNLLVDGKVARTATGPNDRPGGSEELAWHGWDVLLLGRKAQIEILDKRTRRLGTYECGMYKPIGVILADNPKSLEILSKRGNTKVESLEIHELRSAWQ